MRKLLQICTVLFLLTQVLGAVPAQAKVTLSFGVYTSDKPSAMVRQFRPILDVVETRMTLMLGEPVEIRLQVAKTYEQGIADLVEDKVDFARFGPASYIEAKQADPGVTILAVESNDGTKIFDGVISVASESPIKSVDELRGKSFAFGDRRSTIGRYLSQIFLLHSGVHASNLKHYEYLGRHDKVGYAVASGQFDAGALKENTFNKLVASGVPLRAIGRFPNVTKPWIARSGLAGNLRDALRDVLLQIKDEEALTALNKAGFLEGDDGDYVFIREAIRSNHLFTAIPQGPENTN
jgi:phosphonate transport system substrate-binding protein